MKKRLRIKTKQCTLSVLFCLLLFENGIAQQSLVPNGSFENYIVCPSKLNSYQPPPWYPCTSYSLNYSNACSSDIYTSVPYNYYGGPSFQFAHTGFAYASYDCMNGIGANTRTYLQVKLIDSLRKNRLYYGEYYVNMPNTIKLACNNVGMFFSQTAVYVDTNTHPYGVLIVNPQILNYGNPIIGDTLNWIKVSGVFKAQGGEQYLTLGNFKYDNQTNYTSIQSTGFVKSAYYIDDVSVIPLDSFCLKADAGRDTTIKVGDSVFIGSYTNGIDSLMWLQNGITKYDSIRPGFWYTPNTTGTIFFVLQQTVNGCFSSDTVYINVVLPLTMVNYKLLMNNDKQVLNKWETANEINVSHFNIQRSTNGKDFITIGKLNAKGFSYNEYAFTDQVPNVGVNYYRIVSVDKDGKISYSEVKQVVISKEQVAINIYPNPVLQSSWIHIQCKGAKQVVITDYLGSIVFLSTVDRQPLSVNTQQFTKGLYIVQVTTTNGELKTQKLIVE